MFIEIYLTCLKVFKIITFVYFVRQTSSVFTSYKNLLLLKLSAVLVASNLERLIKEALYRNKDDAS